MTTLQINLPDEVKARLEARAAQAGFKSIEQYAEALLLASSEKPEVDESLEHLLSTRAEDDQPGIEFTPQFAEAFRERVRRRRASNGARL
jgi:plasmid stability protein